MSKKTNQFQAEVSELLNLMIHSLYSQREIFLRELISNASDAIDKLKFTALTDKTLKIPADDAFEIRLEPNTAEKSLSVIDNGIGMSYDEVVENIGTIAKSGTKAFLEHAKELKTNPDLIGQFGVGFYSAFMVADRVRLETQKAGESEGVVWESTGQGTYTIEKKTRENGHGTTITVFLKDFSEDESVPDFTQEWPIRSTVKKYSDFIAYPIRMKVLREEPELDSDGKPIEGKTNNIVKDETLNSQKALWLRPSSEIKAEEYQDFYRHLTHDWGEPLKTIHYRAEGNIEYTALAFIPKDKPFNLDMRDSKHGLNLYVNRVFIMNDCEELIPEYLRFVKGLVDSSDLSLNVSREILQQDRQVQAIRKSFVNKILNTLKEMQQKETENFQQFWQTFGPIVKEGIPMDSANKDKILEFAFFQSTASDKWTTLADYVERMPSEQKHIYYITGDSMEQIRNSPYLERLRAKGYEVLLLTDRVDEWVVNSIHNFKDKQLQSITASDLDIDTEAEKQEREKERKEQEGNLKPILSIMKETLKEKIEDVKLSDRLTDSPVCLVSQGGQSAHMERLLKSMGQELPEAKRVLEINPKHPVFEKLKSSAEERQKRWSEILYYQALLNEGGSISDPISYTKKIADLMMEVQD